jgi:hypothetical protein
VNFFFFAPNFFNFFLENIENMFLIAYLKFQKKNLQLKKKKKSHHILTWILVWRHFLDIF